MSPDARAPLQVEAVLDVVLSSAGRLLQGEGGSIMLLVADEELEVVCSPTNPAALGARVRFGEGVAGKVAATRDPALISGRAGGRSKPVDSALSVPLLHQGRIFGVLNVNALPVRSFSEHDLEAATAFAEHAAEALAAARLYEVDRRDGGAQPERHLDVMLAHLARAGSIDFVEPRPPVLVDAAKVARDVASAASEAGRPTSVRGPSPVPVRSDARHLRRALAELVDNGHLHGAPPVRILVAAGESEATLTVADGGDGVPAAERERVFEPYGRLERSANAPGLGLGLTIARRLLESVGGSVEPTETPVGGGAFVVRLPRA
ncbi:MAG TPA: GAF domain-containing sensor histidine kinase [Acidimicrobiales bacterium]